MKFLKDFFAIFTKKDDKTVELPKGLANDLNPWYNNHQDTKIQDDCWHNWVRYEGFREVCDFCTKCDKKRIVDEP